MSQVLTSQVLHEQLSAIMVALSKAAVVDICELFERALTGLRDEVTRSQQENRELRSRLSLIESVVVGGSLTGPGTDLDSGPGSGPREDTCEQAEGQRDHRGSQTNRRAPVSGEELSQLVLIKNEDTDCDEALGAEVKSAVPVEDVAITTAPTRRSNRKKQDKDSESKSSPTEVHNMAAVYSLDTAQLAVDDVAAGESEAEGDVHLPAADQLPYIPGAALLEPHPSENVSYNEPEAFGLQVVSVSGSAPSDFTAPLEHQDEQTGKLRRLTCRLCNKTFAKAQNLDVHTRIHTGERPFSCQQCGKRFTQSAHLKSHLNIHTGARPFACRLCPRNFLTKYTLNMHLKKSHTGT